LAASGQPHDRLWAKSHGRRQLRFPSMPRACGS
jgi:hypothetical protein